MRLGYSLTLLLSVIYTGIKLTSADADIDAHVINRRLEAAILAHNWPTTASSPLCEAFAYIDSAPTSSSASSKSLYQSWKRRYFETLTGASTSVEGEGGGGGGGHPSASDYKNGIQKAIRAASANFDEENLDLKLMKYAMATRAHAPLCEMHRSLAQSAFDSLALLRTEKALIPDAFVVMEESDGETGVFSYATDTDTNEKGEIQFIRGGRVHDAVWANPLPDEEPLYDYNGDEEVAILYGLFDTPSFATLYNALVEQSIPFIVRYMGAIQLKSATGVQTRTVTEATALQGYGVRLDIRNVEYKSFDDKAETETQTHDDAANSNVHDKYQSFTAEQMKEQFSNGIDPAIFQHPPTELNQFFNDYLPHLQLNEHDNGMPKGHIHIPPKSELKNLSVQATTVISQSKDPLWTMQQLSQNLPSFASALANVTVPSSLNSRLVNAHEMIGLGAGAGMEDGHIAFHVNGRRILVERPSFNLFELINVIREENELLRNLDSLGLSEELKQIVAEFVSMGEGDFDALANDDDKAVGGMGMMDVAEPKLRVDVGSGYRGAVVYLNDIEKDEEYREWPKQIQRALYGLQFGGPLTIRKNALTVLLVLDPFDVDEGYLGTLGMILQMMQSGSPVRVGIVFAKNVDIDVCKNYLKTGEDVDDKCISTSTDTKDKDSILASKVTVETIMKVYQHIVGTFGNSIGFPYLYLILEGGLGSDITVQDFVHLHSQALLRMGVPVNDAMSHIVEAIKKEHLPDSKVETYSKAVRFAVTKNVRPGMAVVNGIPFSAENPQEGQKALMQEMQSIVGMMMNGKITDSSPRSIYAMLLKGGNVRKSMHPLLSEESPEYKLLPPGGLDDGCIFELNKIINGPELPKIVVEAIADVVSQDGLQRILALLSSLSVVSDKMNNLDANEQTSIAFCIMPSDVESSQSLLASIFRQANRFDVHDLIGIVESAWNFGKSGGAIKRVEDFDNVDHIRAVLDEVLAEDMCMQQGGVCTFEPIPEEYESSAIILVNGRVFNPTDMVEPEDVEILIDLERGSAKTITERFDLFLHGPRLFSAVAQTAAYLGYQFSSEENERSDALASYGGLIKEGKSTNKDLLYFNWNDDERHVRDGPKVS